ncbi:MULTISPECIES: hypothetical protein [unclassified Pseudomonas]|jgi:hypothetical protein|nr:hypothetical protein [Pseudomonas sp. UYIF39]
MHVLFDIVTRRLNAKAPLPAVYSELVGETAQSVLERQHIWLQRK